MYKEVGTDLTQAYILQRLEKYLNNRRPIILNKSQYRVGPSLTLIIRLRYLHAVC